MEHINIEFLKFTENGNDKIYIPEILAIDGIYYVYANHTVQGGRLRKIKLLVTEYLESAVSCFETAVLKKIKKGYNLVQNGEHINIPGIDGRHEHIDDCLRENLKKEEAQKESNFRKLKI